MIGIHYLDAKGPDGMRLYAIGDVHGRLDLLEAMLAQIDAQLSLKPAKDWRIILLGDYIDRGPDSKGVLDLLCERRKDDPRLVILAGNHDTGLLGFLAHPSKQSLFAGHGGRETALSYGVRADFSSEAMTELARDELLAAIPADHLALLGSLPRSVSFGDFLFCHAGIRPGVPLDEQDAEDLIWIRGEFLRHAGLHPKVIVHGHTPDHQPEVLPNRVNVDTMAYASGVLTALVIDGAEKQFLTAEGRVSGLR